MSNYQVVSLDGTNYCQCGTEESAKMVCASRRGYTYYRRGLILETKPVDVEAVDLGRELQIEGQRALPESELIELNL